MLKSLIALLLLCTVGVFAAPVHAGAHTGPGAMDPDSFARRSGFKGHEEELGRAVADALREASPSKAAVHDFTGHERELGEAVETVVKTLNNRKPYQHEPNDALVKATLTNLQFVKDHGLLDEYIAHEARTQMPMLMRVGKMVDQTGNTEFALIALTERTACFYQLVLDYRRDGELMRWKSPYGHVLEQTRRLGQHDMSEQWIHENYTIPLFKAQAAVMGMDVDISPWQPDGWVSMRVVAPPKAAAR